MLQTKHFRVKTNVSSVRLSDNDKLCSGQIDFLDLNSKCHKEISENHLRFAFQKGDDPSS